VQKNGHLAKSRTLGENHINNDNKTEWNSINNSSNNSLAVGNPTVPDHLQLGNDGINYFNT
jgi:hypothetical protein